MIGQRTYLWGPQLLRVREWYSHGRTQSRGPCRLAGFLVVARRCNDAELETGTPDLGMLSSHELNAIFTDGSLDIVRMAVDLAMSRIIIFCAQVQDTILALLQRKAFERIDLPQGV